MMLTGRVAFLIGAQKSATTFLAELLGAHPDICLSDPKEPDYFTVHHHEPLARYEAAFTSPQRALLLDASTSYSAAPSRTDEQTPDNPRHGVPERIFRTTGPDTRFIYVLRPPVERVWSGYWHDRRLGIERRPFREAIERNSWYLDISSYNMQIERYVEYFSQDSLLILTQEQLIRDPEATLAACMRHLGVAPIRIKVSTDKRNSSYSYNAGGAALLSLAGGSRGLKAATRLARRLLPRRAVDGLRALLTRPIPPMPQTEWQAVYTRLSDDIEKLHARTGIDFRQTS